VFVEANCLSIILTRKALRECGPPPEGIIQLTGPHGVVRLEC